MATGISQVRVVRFGSFELALGSRELRKQGLRIKLQDQPLAVLCLLLEHPGEVVPREEIRQKVWAADTFVDFDVGVNNAVKKLRQALGDSADAPRYIETIPRRGYRFLAPVEFVYDNVVTPTSSATPAEGTPPPARRVVNWKRLAAVGVIALIATTVLGLVRLRTRGVRGQAPSIAVLPFENLSALERNDYFADGMTDAIITNLAQFSGLRVISRTSALHYLRTTKTAPEIGGELGVGAILEGSVVRTGSRVRIDVQLIDAAEDRHLWAQSFERDVQDILTVQHEVADAVATQIAAHFRPSAAQGAAQRKAVKPDAYEAYLRGRYYSTVRPGLHASADTAQAAVKYFQESLRLDPNYAAAYAGLAGAYYQLGFAYFAHTLGPRESARLSEAAAAKALAIDDASADAHLALARVRLAQWRWSDGEKEAHLAMDLDPADTAAYEVYASYLVAAGRPADAVVVTKRALDRDPLSVELSLDLAWWLFQSRDYEASLQQCRTSEAMDPSSPRHRCFAEIYEQQGRYTDAIERYRKLVQLFSDENASANARAELARVYARAGRRTEAGELVKQIERLNRADTAYPLALAYAALGDHDAAIACLERALAEQSGWLAVIKVEPALDSLRADPRFKDIMHRVGVDALH